MKRTVLIWCEINTRIQLSKTLCSLWSEIFNTGETFIEFVTVRLFSSTNEYTAVVMKQRNQPRYIDNGAQWNWGEGQSPKCEQTRVMLHIYRDYIYTPRWQRSLREGCMQVEIEENDRSWPVLKLIMFFFYILCLYCKETFSLFVIISSIK